MVTVMSKVKASESLTLNTNTPLFALVPAPLIDVKSLEKELEFVQNLCGSLMKPGLTTRMAFTGSGCVHVTLSKASMRFIVLGKPSGCRIDCRLLLIC